MSTTSLLSTFVTHPSVRIRGTEHNYTPVPCMEVQCPSKVPHMHCPFCTKSETYLDPVFLKAHYRVKHVDKGIEFAGLKIVRCCQQCDIVGAIKSEKKCKGAHWHCYRCKNGFSRRDEAIKHYKTHFRNPQTTFQIQITQEVNGPSYETSGELQAAHDAPSLAVDVKRVGMDDEGDAASDGRPIDLDSLHVTVAANETIVGMDNSETRAIMIIHQEDRPDTIPENDLPGDTEMPDEKLQLQRRVVELEQQLRRFEEKRREAEEKLRSEVEQLKIQIGVQSQEIETLRRRERDLLCQLNMPADCRIQKLMASLQAEHAELLEQQLQKIRQLALSGIMQIVNSGSPSTPQSLSTPANIVAFVLDGTHDLVSRVRQAEMGVPSNNEDMVVEGQNSCMDSSDVRTHEEEVLP